MLFNPYNSEFKRANDTQWAPINAHRYDAARLETGEFGND